VTGGRDGLRWVLLLGLASLLTTAAAPGAASVRFQQEDPAERMLIVARGLEEEGDLQGAIDEYGQIVQNFPSSPRAVDALIRLVEIHRRLGDTGRALQRADALIEGYTGSPGAAAGHVLRAEIDMEAATSAAELDQARSDLGRVPRIFLPGTYPELIWRARARVRAGEAAFLLGDLEEAAGEFLVTVEDEATSEWTHRARLGLANVLLWQGEWVPAAEILQRVASEAPEQNASPDALARQARRRLELVHRLHLAPGLSRPSWTGTRRLSVSGPELQDPIGVAADDDGSLIIVLDEDDRAFVAAPDGTVSDRNSSSDPRLPVWSDGTPFWVTARGIVPLTARPRRLNFAERRQGESEPEPLENLRAAVRGRYGDWFVLDEDPRQVLAFGPDGAYQRALIGRESDVEAYDVSRDPQGRIYVLDRDGDRVLSFSADGQRLGPAASGDWDDPEALAVDALGNLYVLDRGSETIHVYGRDGRTLATLGPRLPGGLELDSPRDVAVDGSGRIYVADNGLDAILVIE